MASLVMFDSAARLGSFSAAAAELGVGQPAVSHAIRELERRIGAALFERQHRGVKLTGVGEALVSGVDDGLTGLERALAAASQEATHQNAVVRLAVSTATASFWLMPRIRRFKLEHPDIEVQCVTSDSTLTFDFTSVDLFIPVGRGDWSHVERWEVEQEEVYPVCSPGFCERFGGLPITVATLATATLLHLDERHDSRLVWSDWFAGVGHRFAVSGQVTVANDYAVLLQATLEGQGVGLGWHHIVNGLVDSGALIRPVRESVNGEPFFLHASPRRELTEAAATFRDWLVAAAPASQTAVTGPERRASL